MAGEERKGGREEGKGLFGYKLFIYIYEIKGGVWEGWRRLKNEWGFSDRWNWMDWIGWLGVFLEMRWDEGDVGDVGWVWVWVCCWKVLLKVLSSYWFIDLAFFFEWIGGWWVDVIQYCDGDWNEKEKEREGDAVWCWCWCYGDKSRDVCLSLSSFYYYILSRVSKHF